jgi:hypothetical protein
LSGNRFLRRAAQISIELHDPLLEDRGSRCDEEEESKEGRRGLYTRCTSRRLSLGNERREVAETNIRR